MEHFELNHTPSCNIGDCLQAVMVLTHWPYEFIENMAFKEGIYPQGNKVAIDISNANSDDEPLENLIKKMMEEQGVTRMYLVED